MFGKKKDIRVEILEERLKGWTENYLSWQLDSMLMEELKKKGQWLDGGSVDGKVTPGSITGQDGQPITEKMIIEMRTRCETMILNIKTLLKTYDK